MFHVNRKEIKVDMEGGNNLASKGELTGRQTNPECQSKEVRQGSESKHRILTQWTLPCLIFHPAYCYLYVIPEILH